MSILTERLRMKRKEKNITLLEAANKVGVTEATMQRYESGSIKNIAYQTIVALAELYDTTPNYLMGWNNKDSDEIDKKMKTITDRYKDLPEEYQKQFLDYLDFLLEKNSDKKKK